MKTFLLTVIAVVGLLPMSQAWTPEGPVGNGGDAGWQIPADGFGPPRDFVAPKNLGEEYRLNVPVLFYACDANFLDYFGSNGKTAIDHTFAILNKAFTNNPTGRTTGLDGYSQNLSEFPLNTIHMNYQAQALGLYDLSSYTLGLMMTQMGLADPVMYIWNIHDWAHVGTVGCPVGQEYTVVQRNFDYVSSPLNQLQYSAYVNDTLYSYDIIEFCTGPNPLRYASPFPVDPLADIYTPVASSFNAFSWGDFYTGLTRDDVAGLRYLLKANNINWETASADSLQFVITTNTQTPEVFPPYISGATNFVFGGANGGYYVGTLTNAAGAIAGGYGDLAAFLSFITTNNPAAVQAAYPGIVITSVSNTVVIVSNAIVTAYFTTPIGSPYGSPPTFVMRTNYQPVFQVKYFYTFQNLFTNHYFANTKAILQTTTTTAPVGAPFGSPVITNTTITLLSHPSGDFFILSPFYTGYCPIDILPYGSIPTVLATTNLITGATTNFTSTGTNAVATNITTTVSLVTYFTNFSYMIAPVTCSTVAGATGLYEGIEKLQFVGTSFDSLLGQFYEPITNNYTMNYVTNGQVQVQYFQRIVTVPDYLFSAADLATIPADPQLGTVIDQEQLGFFQGNVYPGLAGPGTINHTDTITFTKGGPVYYNSFGDVMNGTPYFTVLPGTERCRFVLSDLFCLGFLRRHHQRPGGLSQRHQY